MELTSLKKYDDIPKTITIEKLIEEQNYKPISAEEFFEKAKKIDIQEPIEELLSMLTK